MPSKYQRGSVGSASGFKKRVLKPVSNRPTAELATMIKNSRVLNLRDSLSVKNKYAQVKSFTNTLIDQLQVQFLKIQQDMEYHRELVTSKGLQHVKAKVSSIRQKRKQSLIKLTTNDSSVKQAVQKLPFNQKGVTKILSELQIENVQDGLKLLYNEQLELGQILENLCGIVSIAGLARVDWMRDVPEGLGGFGCIEGNEEDIEYLVKMIGVRLREEFKNSKVEEKRDTVVEEVQALPKFKPIFSANHELQQAKEQATKLKVQVQQLRETICELQTKISEYESAAAQTKLQQSFLVASPSFASPNPQKIHRELQAIYDEAIKLRNNQIQKLRTELLETQQIMTKQFNFNDIIGEPQRRSIRKQQAAVFNQLSQNEDNKDFAFIVQEQFEKMRKGFTKKLDKLQGEFAEREQKLKKQIFNLEKTVQGLEWEKKLILKKYEFLLQEDERKK